MLHWINKSGEYSISSENFEKLLIWLSEKRTEKLINLDNKSKEKQYYISFDDVPDSIYNIGFPLLIKYQIPFTLFIATSLLNKPGYITTDQLREMSKSDLCTIGSHGVSHCFYRFNKDKLLEELNKSKKQLEYIINKRVSLFAFLLVLRIIY